MTLPNCLLPASLITMVLAIVIVICVSLVILTVQVIHILGSFVINVEMYLKCDGRTVSLCFTLVYFIDFKVLYNVN